ncbi:hypothetical protein [Pseudonocardia sp. T1-2H]|uniref:hypothetical protein n=1 Tax=Pseudonocardia sp. T1-2H TaxID=3128899 RepID=UPI003100FACC
MIATRSGSTSETDALLAFPRRRRAARAVPDPDAEDLTGLDEAGCSLLAARRRRKNAARAAQRARLRAARVPDPVTGELTSLDKRCKHGTEAGYTNYSCNCLDLADVPRLLSDNPNGPREPSGKPGCKPVGLAATRARK